MRYKFSHRELRSARKVLGLDHDVKLAALCSVTPSAIDTWDRVPTHTFGVSRKPYRVLCAIRHQASLHRRFQKPVGDILGYLVRRYVAKDRHELVWGILNSTPAQLSAKGTHYYRPLLRHHTQNGSKGRSGETSGNCATEPKPQQGPTEKSSRRPNGRSSPEPSTLTVERARRLGVDLRDGTPDPLAPMRAEDIMADIAATPVGAIIDSYRLVKFDDGLMVQFPMGMKVEVQYDPRAKLLRITQQ